MAPATSAKAAAKPKLSEYLSDRLEELEKETGVLQVGQETIKIAVQEGAAKQGVVVSTVREALAKHEEMIRERLAANPLNYLEDRFLALEA